MDTLSLHAHPSYFPANEELIGVDVAPAPKHLIFILDTPSKRLTVRITWRRVDAIAAQFGLRLVSAQTGLPLTPEPPVSAPPAPR